jgi:hypothetical protein
VTWQAAQQKLREAKAAKLSAVLDNKAADKLRQRIKGLEQEYKALPSTLKVKINVPLELRLELDLPETLEEYVSNNEDHSYEDEASFIRGFFEFHASIPNKGGDVNKVQKEYLSNYLHDLEESICEESVYMFPEHKKFKQLAAKVNKVREEFGELCKNTSGEFHFLNELFQSKSDG